MKKILTALLLALSLSLMANGLSLNSVGSKAFGMGGAFVALADDPTAIHWNPAGMAGQKNSVLVFMTDVIPLPSYLYKNDAYMIDVKADGVTGAFKYVSPNLMAVYNYDKFTFGLGVYVPAGLGTEWDGADLTDFNGPAAYGSLFADKEFDWMSKIAVFNVAPAVAYNYENFLKLGVGLNAYYGMFQMKRGEDMLNNFTGAQGADGMLDTQTEMDIDGWGVGATLSILLDYEWYNFGMTYKTPVKVDMGGTMDIERLGEYGMNLEVTWPAWAGIGLAFKPFNGKMVITSDLQVTNWKELETLYAEILGMPVAPGVYMDVEQEMHLNWHDAVQVRFGVQYDINDQLTARTGYYYDPAPAPDKTLNILFPSSSNHAFTYGGTYKVNKFSVDLGMEYLFGNDRYVNPTGLNMPGTHQMDVFAYSLGVKYDF